jgi:beta-lactamase superfamily II metal-dependent hydrolase
MTRAPRRVKKTKIKKTKVKKTKVKKSAGSKAATGSGTRLRVFRSDKGDCTLLLGSGGGKILCDGGMKESFVAHVAPELAKLDGLDLVYVSHVDDDHISGVLQLLDNAMAWKVFDFHRKNGGGVKEPKVPKAPKIGRIWHNAFHDQIGKNAGDAEDMLAAMVPVLASVDDHDFAHSAAENFAIVNSNKQAIQVSQRVGAKQLGIALNEGDKLMMIRKGQRSFQFGSLTVNVIAPFARDIEIFREKWNDWLRDNRDTVKTLRAKAKAAEDSIGNDLDRVLTPLALEVKELGNRTKVTPPNLASIMLYVTDKDRTILMTGDGHGTDVIKGLEFLNVLPEDGMLHVDLLKVQHHGSEHNMPEDFPKRITADHYVFCGNGFSGNPEPDVVDLLFNSRTKGKFGPDRNFKFYFNSSKDVETTKAERAKHMAAIEKQVAKMKEKEPRFDYFFLKEGSFFDIKLK